MLGVPVMAPVAEAMTSPVGRPVAVQVVMVAAADESVAVVLSEVTAVPDGLSWAPGLVTVTVLVMVQVKLAEPGKPELSVAVSTTV